MMGVLVPETRWGNKTAYFVASSWLFTFHYDYNYAGWKKIVDKLVACMMRNMAHLTEFIHQNTT
jgi:hypothetical protein